MRIGLGQITTTGDKEANLVEVHKAVLAAAEQNAELLVFPEATMQGFGTGRLDEQAEELDGEFVTTIQSLADEHNMAIVAGVFTPADTVTDDEGKEINRIHNVAVVAIPGQSLVHYNKIHTFDAYGYKESDTVKPGEKLVKFDYLGKTFGLAVCYDIRFPQQFRELARAGAQAIIVPTSWADGDGKLVQWRALAKARALDSTTYVIASDQAPAKDKRSKGAPTGIGHSIIADPQGETLAELGDEPEVKVFDIDIDVTKDREALPVLEYPENDYEF